MKLTAVVCTLSLLVGVALIATPVSGAPWISASDTYAAAWVKDIEKELLKKEHWMIYANDPRSPQQEVLRLLNRAASAQESGNRVLAQELAREALEVFEEGVRRHYYTEADIEPIVSYIKNHMPIKIQEAGKEG
ncbi:MAG TPA: hypothetical protein VFS39_17395 [Nitrospira sp.]|nr:hypothetical protein [Nitrospira sp.]